MTQPDPGCLNCRALSAAHVSVADASLKEHEAALELHAALMELHAAEMDLKETELADERLRTWTVMVWASEIQEASKSVLQCSRTLTGLMDRKMASLQADLDAAQARIRELEAGGVRAS